MMGSVDGFRVIGRPEPRSAGDARFEVLAVLERNNAAPVRRDSGCSWNHETASTPVVLGNREAEYPGNKA
jgi:hypothetical protein